MQQGSRFCPKLTPLITEVQCENLRSLQNSSIILPHNMHYIRQPWTGSDLQLWGPRGNQNAEALSATTNLGYENFSYSL
jgi:hypothetical protein